MQILENFMPSEIFQKFHYIVTDHNFPWRVRNAMTDDDSCMWLNHSIFDEHQIQSPTMHADWILPILSKLRSAALINAGLNLYFNKIFSYSGWHRDFLFVCKTGIFNLNDSDGGTEFEIDDEIKFVPAVANTMIVFDSTIKHRAKSSMKNDLRYVLNLNFIDTSSMFDKVI